MLGRRAHGELVHVRLAGDDRAGLVEALSDVGVVGADEALEDAAAGGRGPALGDHEVLERDRDPEQRRQVRHGRLPCPASHLKAAVGGIGGIGGTLVVE